MTKHTIYARPTIISQANNWKSDRKYSSWANTSYMGSPQMNSIKVDNKFEGAWISDTGSGNLAESYKTNQIKYSKIYLNSKQYNKKKAPVISVRNFYLQIPKNATISKVGIIVSCYSDRNMNIESPTISSTNNVLPSKNLHSVYSKEKDHYITNDTKYATDTRLFVSKNIPYARRNITYQWSGKDLKNVDRVVLSDSEFGFHVNFKENKSHTGGFIYVDAIAMYVEYETPEYEIINGYEQEDAVIGEKFHHRIRLKNTNGKKIDKTATKLKIPSCFDVIEDECTVTKGTFGRYDGTDYEYIYNTKIIPLNGDMIWYKVPDKGKNSVVVRGTNLVVHLVDGYGHSIPYKQVTFKIANQLYTKVTDYEGHAWLRINLAKKGTYDVECSFVDDFYESSYTKFKMEVVEDKSVDFELLDGVGAGKKFYQGSYYTVRLLVGNEEIVPTGSVQYTFVNKNNSKEKKVFTEKVDSGGSASHLINFGAGKTWNLTLKYIPKNVKTDSDGAYQYYFNSKTYTTTLTIDAEQKQDATISVVGNKTGYNKYNYDTNQYEFVQDNIYHVANNHHIIFKFTDSNGRHILDREPVDIQVITKYNEKTGKWEYLDDIYSVYRTTTYAGRTSYDFNIPVGIYQMEVSLLPNTASHWTKAVLQITVQVHDPPLDDTYNYMWVCDEPNEEYLDIVLVPNTMGACKISAWNTITGSSTDCVYNIQEFPDGDGIFVLTNSIHRNTDEFIDVMFQFDPRDYSPDFTDTFKITCNCKYSKTVGSITKEYEMFDDIDWDSVKWEDVDGATLNKGYLVGKGSNGTYSINIYPYENSRYIAYVKLPIHTHAPAGYVCKFCFQIENNTYQHCHEINVLEQLPFKMNLNPVEAKLVRHSSQLSRATWQGYIMDCGGALNTNFNVQKGFEAIVENPFLFIGPVRLNRSHANPTGSTEQELLSRQYKNRVILKKKGDYVDKVDTTIRLTPQQLATIKGLCKLDMPTPMHLANVPAWNPLTVHGWVELYATSGEKEINSSLYEAKLEWRYLTKELYSLMTIIRDKEPLHTYKNSNNFGIVHYTSDPVLDFFDYKGEGMIVENDDEDYSEIYVESGNSEALTSTEPVPTNSRITIDWKDYLQYKSNDALDSMSRRFVILTKDKDTGQMKKVFEYIYSDFTHFLYDNEYPVDTIVNDIQGKAIVYENDAPRVLGSSDIILDFDEEYVSGNANSSIYTSSEGYPNYTVGSKTIFTFNGNKLTLQDCGASGNENMIENIKLDDGKYYIRMELFNQSDEDYSDFYGSGWTSLVTVQEESDLNNPAYDNIYAEHIVSPSPIPNAPLSFTRYGEDGLIYYYRYKDGNSYKYRGDPYTPYKNGTNFSTIDGVSLFDCNNDFSPLCLSNGLIKVAIHRYAGYVEFYRWNHEKEDYVLTNSMWADMDNRHIQVDKITDDFIQLTWGSTTWTIWRGRPFVEVQHNNVDFSFQQTIQKIYADIGDGVMNTYDIGGNLNLLDYLGKNASLDESLVDTGISNLPKNSTNITYSAIQSIIIENEKETVKNTANLTASPISIDVNNEELLKVSCLVYNDKNKLQKGIVCHLYSYDEENDIWINTGLHEISDTNGSVIFTEEYNVENANTSIKYKILFDGTDNFRGSESTEFIVNYGANKKEPNMKIFITPKNSNRVDVDGNPLYYVGDKVDITAVLVDEDLNPISGDVLFYYDTTTSKLPTYTALTDSNGVAKWIDATLPSEGYRYIHAKYNGNDKFDDDDASVQCTIRDKVVMELVMNPTKPVLGDEVTFTLTLKNSSGEELSGEQINYEILNTHEYGYGNTSPEGKFSFKSSSITVNDTSKQILFSYNGSSLYDPTEFIFNFNVSKESTIAYINLSSNNISLKNGTGKVTISGKVTNLAGAGVSGLTVKLYDDNGYKSASTTTGSDGTYSIDYSYIKTGLYHVYVMVSDDNLMYADGNSVSKELNIEPESLIMDTNIILETSSNIKVIGELDCNITVTLHDENNAGIPNAKIKLFENGVKINEGLTDNLGEIVFDYAQETVGTYTITASYDGEEDIYNSCSITDGLKIAVEDSNGVIVTNLIMDSSSGTSTVFNGIPLPITGLLRDKDGNAVPNQTISLVEDDIVIATNITNASGLCTFYYMSENIGSHEIYLDYVSNGTFKSSKSEKKTYEFSQG